MSDEKTPPADADLENTPVAAEATQDAPEPPETAAEAAPKDPAAALLEQLDAAQAEARGWQERYLRGVAELENYRKRAFREKDEARRYASSALVEDILPVLDNFAMGLQAAEASEATRAFAQGFEMIRGQLQQALESNGVQTLNPVGEAFDPHRHESVSHEASESVPEGHIIAVQRVGYLLHERLIRAASVVVSSGTGTGEKASQPEEASA